MSNSGGRTSGSNSEFKDPRSFFDDRQHVPDHRVLDHALVHFHRTQATEWGYLHGLVDYHTQILLHGHFRDGRHWNRKFETLKLFTLSLFSHFKEIFFPNFQVMPIENSMAHPNHFIGCPGVLNISMTVVVSLYALMGIFGYLRYGEESKASITLNLPIEELWVSFSFNSKTKKMLIPRHVYNLSFFNDSPAQIVKVLIALAVMLTYGLQFFVPLEIIWNSIKDKFSHNWESLGNTVMRILMVLFTGNNRFRSRSSQRNDSFFRAANLLHL